MNLTSEELLVVGTLGGAMVGGVFGVLTSWITKRSEERRAHKELIMRVAADIFIHQDKAAQARGGVSNPYHTYLLLMLVLSKFVKKRNLTSEKVEKIINETKEIMKASDRVTRTGAL